MTGFERFDAFVIRCAQAFPEGTAARHWRQKLVSELFFKSDEFSNRTCAA